MQLIKTIVCIIEATKKQKRGKKHTNIYKALTLSKLQPFPHSFIHFSQWIAMPSVLSRFLKLWKLSLKLMKEWVKLWFVWCPIRPHSLKGHVRAGLHSVTRLRVGLCLKPSRKRLHSSNCSLKHSCPVSFLYKALRTTAAAPTVRYGTLAINQTGFEVCYLHRSLHLLLNPLIHSFL